MRIVHTKTGASLGKNVLAARTFWPRLKGFMFQARPEPYDVIYFPRCNWVHNCFVRFPIDLVFVNKAGVIVGIQRGFRPWRFSRMYWRAADTLEFAVGVLPVDLVVGDVLRIDEGV